MERIKLYGVLADGTRAKTHQAKGVVAFENDKGSVRVTRHWGRTNFVCIKTAKGSYIVNKVAMINRYEGKMNGMKAHVMLKKIVGEIIYWPKGV